MTGTVAVLAWVGVASVVVTVLWRDARNARRPAGLGEATLARIRGRLPGFGDPVLRRAADDMAAATPEDVADTFRREWGVR
jgi:hypothetical protein